MRPILMTIIAVLLMVGHVQAQWQTKTYHAKQYTPSTGSATAQATVNVQNYDPGKDLNDDVFVEIARVKYAQAKWQAEAERNREKYAAYLQALGEIGVSANGQGYSSASVAQSSAYGGNSIYGYSYSTVADYWNPADRNVLANQAYNATNRAIDLADKWGGNMSSLYANEIEAQTRVAEAISGRELAAAVLEGAAKVAESSKQSRTRVQTTQQAFGPQGQPVGNPPTPPQDPNQFSSQSAGIEILQAKCGTCHSGKTPAKGIVLDGSVSLSNYEVGMSFADIATGKMPKDAAEPLTPEEAEAIKQALASLGPR